MRPLLFHVLGIPVPAWHFFFAAAAVAAFFWFQSAICKTLHGISAKSASVIFSAGYSGVIIGAIVWAQVIEGAGSYPEGHPSHLAMASSGGIIGGLICGLLAARFFQIPVGVVGDAAAGPILLAFAIGRIGCFLNGDDYGSAVLSDFNWLGVIFPNLHDGGVLRHPVQLYESAGCLLGIFMIRLFRFIAALQNRAPVDGAVGSFSLIWYALLRFSLEYLRDDWRGLPTQISETLQFSPPQVLAWVLFVLGTFFLLRLRVHE